MRAPCILLLMLVGAFSAIAADPGASVDAEEAKLLSRLATEGTNAATLYALADLCHDAGVDGDKKAVGRAEDYLRQLLQLEPTNAPAMALLGSVYTLKGRDAFWPTTQIRLVREGNTYMDKAVSLAPQDPKTRQIRALNNAHMPEFLGRSQIVLEDLAWLWARIEEDSSAFTISARQQVALHWGRRLKGQRKLDEARRVWAAGRSLAPDSEVAHEIAREENRL